MFTLDISKEVVLTDGTFRLTPGAGGLYRQQNLGTGEISTAHLSDIVARFSEAPAWVEVHPANLFALSRAERRDVDMWKNHVVEMTSGVRPGHTTPRPEYDPNCTTLNKRVEAKVTELNALGLPASRASLLRKKALYEKGGAAALIDGRKLRQQGKFDRTDSRIVDALATVISRRANKTTVTQSLLHELVEKELKLLYKSDAPDLPARATLYRYFAAYNGGKEATGKATTRQSKGNTPKRTHGTSRRLLPGEEVQVDSTWMDILVTVPGRKEPVRPRLTIMVDRATRSIIASTIRLDAAKGYDHALLLAQALVPYQQRPDRTTHRALISARRPDFPLLSPAERLNAERLRPFIYPRQLTVDNGKDFLSDVFTSACRKYNVAIVMSAIHTPTDKPIVERHFQSINTLFTQRLPGYVGNHTVNRGYNVEKENLLDIHTLAELFDDWVVSVYQNRPHGGLMDPFEPSTKYSPNQAAAAAAAYSSTVKLPLSQHDYIDLLPTQHRVIGTLGVELGKRHYDSDELQPLRGTLSRLPYKEGKWEVKYNPYDVMHVWVRGLDDTWIECTYRQAASISQPFFAEISQEMQKTTRSDFAHEAAALEGTPMPTGTPEPAIVFTHQDLAEDFTDFGLIDDDQE